MPTDMQTDEEWRRGIFSIYARMRQRPTPYDVMCAGLNLTVLEHVYAPDVFTDSAWFAEGVAHLIGTSSLLEIGTGTGVIAIRCARGGAPAVATDINPAAVRNARMNAFRLAPSLSVREGNLFDPLRSDERFDYIFWAHPFNRWELPGLDMLMRSGIDPHYEALSGYIAGARHHLRAGGTLLLGTGDSADRAAIAAIAQDNGYHMREMRSARMPLAYGADDQITYLIYALEGGG